MRKNVTGADNQQGSPLYKSIHDPSETTRWISHNEKELAILLGLLFTDGCVSPKQKNSWRIYFSAKSENLTDLFQDQMIILFDLSEKRVRIDKTADGLFRAIVDSKAIGNYLVSNFGTFRTLKFEDGTLPNTRLPVERLLKNGYTADFLRAAFSCDGGISFYPAYRTGSRGGTRWLIRTVFLACSHPSLRADYSKLLKHLGIEARDVAGDGKLKLERKDDIIKFQKYIGFFENTNVTLNSKYWNGYDKQDVLELLVSSYEDPRAIYTLQKFHWR